MKLPLSRLVVLISGGMLLLLVLVSACTPQATPPPVDVAATVAMRLASEMLTQTLGAASPTPLPATITPLPTETAVPTEKKALKRTEIRAFTGCYYGPGPEYTLDSNIDAGRRVDIVGIGNTPGWYVIVNPYFHKQCWVNANDLEIDPARDLSTLPVMTPIP